MAERRKLEAQEAALALNAKWQRQHATQARSLSRAVGGEIKAEDMMMLTAGGSRRQDNEMLDLMQMAKPFHDRHGNAAFQMSMRDCRERWNSVGGKLSGLWTKYYEASKEEFEEQFEVVRVPEVPGGAISRARPKSAAQARAAASAAASAAVVRARPPSKPTSRPSTAQIARPRPSSPEMSGNRPSSARETKKPWYERSEHFIQEREGPNRGAMRRMSAVGFGGGVDPSRLYVVGTGEEAAAEKEAAAAAAAMIANVAEAEGEVVAEGEEAGPEPVAAPPPLSCELSEGRLCLEATAGATVAGFVTLRNLGSSLLHYRWARRQRQPEQAAPAPTSPRVRVRADRFFCRGAPATGAAAASSEDYRRTVTDGGGGGGGALLPGQALPIEFCFRSDAPGSYLEEWELVLTPPLPEGEAVTLQLRGVALEDRDAAAGAARAADAALRRKQAVSAVRDIVLRDIVDRVVAPPPPPRPEPAPPPEAAAYARWAAANHGRHLYYDAQMWAAFEDVAREAEAEADRQPAEAEAEADATEHAPGTARFQWDGDVAALEARVAALPRRDDGPRDELLGRVETLLEECSAPPPPGARTLAALVRRELCAAAEAVVEASEQLCSLHRLQPRTLPAAPPPTDGADADADADAVRIVLREFSCQPPPPPPGAGDQLVLVLRQAGRELHRGAAVPRAAALPELRAVLAPANAFGLDGELQGCSLELWAAATGAAGDGAPPGVLLCSAALAPLLRGERRGRVADAALPAAPPEPADAAEPATGTAEAATLSFEFELERVTPLAAEAALVDADADADADVEPVAAETTADADAAAEAAAADADEASVDPDDEAEPPPEEDELSPEEAAAAAAAAAAVVRAAAAAAWAERMKPRAPWAAVPDGEARYRRQLEARVGALLGGVADRVELQGGELAPLHSVRRPPSPSRWERKDAENKAYLFLEEQQAQLRRESERAAAQPPPEAKGKGKKGKR